VTQLSGIYCSIFLLTILYPGKAFTQSTSATTHKHNDSLSLPKIQQMAEDTSFFEFPDTGIYKGAFIDFDDYPIFPGGDKAVVDYVLQNTNYPQSAIKDSIQGRVVLRFAIDVDGSTCDFLCLRSIRSDLDSECIRVIKSMPKWKPGSTIRRANKGLYYTKVKTYYSIPFDFSLKNNENKKGIIINPRQSSKN
jgi:TonB family protein